MISDSMTLLAVCRGAPHARVALRYRRRTWSPQTGCAVPQNRCARRTPGMTLAGRPDRRGAGRAVAQPRLLMRVASEVR
jgi:hypothetical protein